MTVKLISITQPVNHEAKSAEELISYCARVSNPSNQNNFDTANKLLKYCLKKSHWSPFEMVDLTFEINTTRDIGRQILRHKSFSFQEFSQRYAVVDINLFVDRELRFQDDKNRQNSISIEEYSEHEQFNKDILNAWQRALSDVKNICGTMYRWAIKHDVAKEQARVMLPEGLTLSTMYMKGSLRSWFHFCLIRCKPSTQKEHREIAKLIWSEIQLQFPFLKGLNIEQLGIMSENSFEADMRMCWE